MKSSLNLFLQFVIFLFSINSALAETIIPSAPRVSASSYIVMDAKSEQILVDVNSNKILPPASLTKMMTVYVAAHELATGKITLEDKVLVSEKAWRMPGSRMFIEVDKMVTVDELMHGIIIQSGNDASVAIAEYISGSEDLFAELMNEHAKRLGMSNTSYRNSTGLPQEGHHTTSNDLAILARALINDFPEIYSWHKIKEYTFNDIKQNNRNKLLWTDRTVDGVKTGHTEEAGFCLVASAERDGMRLISVVMGTDSKKARTESSQKLLNYGFRFFKTKQVLKANELITTEKIWKGETESINLGVKDELFLTLPEKDFDNLILEPKFNKPINAPIAKNSVIGELEIISAGKVINSVKLIALQQVEQGNFIKQIKDEVLLLLE